MINLLDEISPYSTWLAAMHVKHGKIHFFYRASNPWDSAIADTDGPGILAVPDQRQGCEPDDSKHPAA